MVAADSAVVGGAVTRTVVAGAVVVGAAAVVPAGSVPLTTNNVFGVVDAGDVS